MFLTIFRRFPTIFRRFPKIFKMLSEGRTNVAEHFPNFPENIRRLPTIAEEDLKVFRLNITIIFLIEHWNMINSAAHWSKMKSHVWISFLSTHMWYNFSRFATTRYTTAVYIIIMSLKRFSDNKLSCRQDRFVLGCQCPSGCWSRC